MAQNKTKQKQQKVEKVEVNFSIPDILHKIETSSKKFDKSITDDKLTFIMKAEKHGENPHEPVKDKKGNIVKDENGNIVEQGLVSPDTGGLLTSRYGLIKINIQQTIYRDAETFGITKDITHGKDSIKREMANQIGEKLFEYFRTKESYSDENLENSDKILKWLAKSNYQLIIDNFNNATNNKFSELTNNWYIVDRIWTQDPRRIKEGHPIVDAINKGNMAAVANAMINILKKSGEFNTNDNQSDRTLWDARQFFNTYYKPDAVIETTYEQMRNYVKNNVDKKTRQQIWESDNKYYGGIAVAKDSGTAKTDSLLNDINNANNYGSFAKQYEQEYGMNNVANVNTQNMGFNEMYEQQYKNAQESSNNTQPIQPMPSEEKTQPDANMAQRTVSQQLPQQNNNGGFVNNFKQAFNNAVSGTVSIVKNLFTRNNQNEQQTNENINMQ